MRNARKAAHLKKREGIWLEKVDQETRGREVELQ